MFMTLWLYGLEIRLHGYMYVCLYVCDISKFVLHSTYIIISNSVAETKMTVHIRFVNLCTGVTTDDDNSR